jgi:NADPH:quinone reductase-like Zn-dependent oxidoreductase
VTNTVNRVRAFVKADGTGTNFELADVDVPTIGDNQLLVRVYAVGVGIHDSYFLPDDVIYPYPIGIEGAGVVEAVATGVTEYRLGDRIAFVSSMQTKGGTWAEFAVVDSSSLILRVPADVDFVEAVALPVAGGTCLRAIAALSHLPSGASLFVAGGAGAIGSLTIQIARQHGWRVAASASARNHDYMRSLGAQAVVDYHDADWTDQVRRWQPDGVDAAIAVQPDTTFDSMRVVKDGGTAITISGDTVTPQRGIHVEMVAHEPDVREQLSQLLRDVGEKKVHLELEHVYRFDQAAEALARVQTRHVRGKLALRLDPPVSG